MTLAFAATINAARRMLDQDARPCIGIVAAAGVSISPDGHTAIVQAGAAGSSNDMVAAADDLKAPLRALGTG